MGRKENESTDNILNAIAPHGVKLTRLQAGQWKTDKGHYIRGADEGWGDYIGWRKMIVTPDMVGKPIAQFVSVECKTKTGRVADQQRVFRRVVEAEGGLAGICRTPAEALKLIGA